MIGEPAAAPVAELLEDPAGTARISAVNVAEALDSITRLRGWPHDDVAEKLRWLKVGGLQVEAVTEAVALVAARLRSEHYHRERCPISIADCIALALALQLGERLATSDPALLTTAKNEKCEVIALPDSQGRIPE